MSSASTEPSIASQVDDFNRGFTAAIGPDLSAVFAGEQADLTAAGAPDGAVRVGDTVPDRTLVDAAGEQVALSTLTGGGTAVLVFYRGSWCPYCDITLRTYQRDLVPALDARGVPLVAISPQTLDASALAGEKAGATFTLATDPGLGLAAELGIVTEPSAAAQQAHIALGFEVKDSNADDTPAVPFPTVLVIDGDRVVRFADVRVDYTTRTEPADVLAALDRESAAV